MLTIALSLFLAAVGVRLAPEPSVRIASGQDEEVTEQAVKAAIDRGVDFLLRSQVKSGRNRGAFGNSGISAGVATASLGGLAMMCGGHAPGQGRFGKAIDLCTEFVCAACRIPLRPPIQESRDQSMRRCCPNIFAL